MNKKAFITGITGQDGAYLTRLLLDKGYDVYGLCRRNSIPNTGRIQSMLKKVNLVHGDMTDSTCLIRLMQDIQPDEVYNLAAQSHVGVSFDTPEYTANVDALGTLRLLEAIRILGLEGKTKYYQASTSELFGMVQQTPQNEQTPFYPRSPYGVAKLYAYWTTVNYREAYGIHASNGILFNHESPLRGEDFVTRKITKAVASIEKGTQETLYLGNLNARRDWGHAKDYVDGMWRMMQQNHPDDYVFATGKIHSVREFVELAFSYVGRSIEWTGQGADEIGVDAKTGQILVKIDPQFYRPSEVDLLVGDASKAKDKLGWSPRVLFADLVQEMVDADIDAKPLSNR